MAQEENFLKNSFRTDLACESRDVWLRTRGAALAGVSARQETRDGLGVETVEILDEGAAEELCKPMGRYVTISLDALVRREEDAFRRVCGVLAREIRTQLAMESEESVLVVGLGNPDITPDAVGPKVCDHVIATRHLITRSPEYFAAWRPVCALAPGVLGQTGVEANEVIRGVLDRVRPGAVIAVDALAAGRLSRLVRTVQLTDTGIVPGSGVGNARAALNEQALGVPVLAVGVPTVADGGSIAHEIACQLGGAACEALDDLSQPFIITTRDIDREVADTARLIGYAVNMALQGLSVEDIDLYLS